MNERSLIVIVSFIAGAFGLAVIFLLTKWTLGRLPDKSDSKHARIVIIRGAAVLVSLVAWVLFTAHSGGSSFKMTRDVETRVEEKRQDSVGQPWAWYVRRAEKVVVNDRVERDAVEGGIRFDSPAWLLLAGCVGLLVWQARLRPVHSPESSDATDTNR